MSAMLVLPMSLTAQTPVNVSGVVSDEKGEPLPGAVIVVKCADGTVTGSFTADVDGRYDLSCHKGDVIEAYFLGFDRRNEPVDGRTKIDFILHPDAASTLDEVVVIGFGEVKKSDLTGSVTHVKMGDVREAPVTSIDEALQGRIAGADIMSTSGDPGSTTSIRIRGTRSITAGNDPLIVVDGVMDAVSDLNDINPADIESISVMKDASSTAIYGARGANGVIIITTKGETEHKSEKVSVRFKATGGVSHLPKELDIMNATEFAMYRNEYKQAQSGYAETPVSGLSIADPFSYGEGTDWVREITRVAPYQDYNLSLNGRAGKSTYFASVGYTDNQGIIRKSGENKMTASLNVSNQIFKWLKLSAKLRYTYRHKDELLANIGGTNYYNGAIYLSPLLGTEDSYNPLYNSGQRVDNPYVSLREKTYYTDRSALNASVIAEAKICKGLTFKSQFSYYDFHRETFRYYSSTLPARTDEEGGEAFRRDSQQKSLSIDNTLTYNKSFKGGHSLNVMAGQTGYTSTTDNFSLSGEGYMVDEMLWNNMNAVKDKNTYTASTSNVELAKLSFFGRLNYDYGKRYYLTVTARGDASSNFAADHKWGFFPSAALKWTISNEKWMRNASAVDELSLRVSAGRSGNDAIGAYASMAKLSTSTQGYIFGGTQPVSYYPSRLDSPDLTWETTDLYNVALVGSIFNSRLSFELEAYYAKTTDLLLNIDTPTHTGYQTRFANLGATSNKGLELTLNTRNIVSRNFSWTSDLTISHNTQMVLDTGPESRMPVLESPNDYMMLGYVKGYPLNALWGFEYGGVWHTQEEIERNKVTRTYVDQFTGHYLGYPRVIDRNHDGILNSDDLCYLGNADPVLYGGFQNTFRIRNFSLGVYLAYSLGGKIYNYAEMYMAGSRVTNQYRYMINSWDEDKNIWSDYPRAGCNNGALLPGTAQVHDASYLRLKNVSLSYNLNIRSSVIRQMTFTLSGENLWLWSDYNGFDPDISSETDAGVIRRLDLGAYPKPRRVVFSIQLSY